MKAFSSTYILKFYLRNGQQEKLYIIYNKKINANTGHKKFQKIEKTNLKYNPLYLS